MRSRGIGALGLCLAFLGSGCAANRVVGPGYAESKPTEARPDAALVYLLRTRAEPVTRPATILVDDAEMAELSQGAFTWFYVPPGRHVIHARWGLATEQLPSHATLELKAGETYYLELTGVSRETGHGIVRGSWLRQLPTFDAETKLTRTRSVFQKPRPTSPTS